MDLLVPFLIFCGLASISEGTPQLLFANRKDIRLVNVTDRNPNVSVVIGNLDDAAAVDFMYSLGYIFWTDIDLEVIQRAVINRIQETKVGIITTGLVSPDGLACDWVGNKLYWTDAEKNRIEVSNLDGTYRKVLYWQNLDQPRAIALDPYEGYMYWTDWGEVPKIERAGMDGTLSTRTIIVDDNIYWPNGLTIDYDQKKIYWADAKLSYIHKCDYDGSHREVVIGKDLAHPFALTLYEDNLYWTDWETKAIHICNKFTGQEYRTILKDIHSPMDIHVFEAARQIDVSNPCDTDNGGCSHLCLLSPIPPNYKCACPIGVRLLDEKTCADGAEEMLLLARRTDIRMISLDTPDFTDVVLLLNDIKHAIAIDYDPVEGYVYWTDDQVRSIRRAFLNGTGQEVVIDTEVNHPDGMAVDWVGRNLYWTDTGTDRIEVARLNGTSRKILISERLDEPRALCLDPERGYMWWTDWGKEPKIEKAYLDGTNRQVVIDKDLDWPNGIVVDYVENKIYWCDAKRDRIEVANMDGSGRRLLVKEHLPHLFGFSLLGDYLYWTEWQRRSVERVNKRTGGDRKLIIDQLPDLMGIKAVNVKKVEGTNGCADNNGWCSHLCLYTPEGPQCACPMGLELINKGKKCIVPEAFLLYTREGDIKRVSLATSHRVVPIPLKGIEKAMSIDFDIGDNRIYWTDGKLLSISRAFLNGSSIEHIVEFGITGPEGMAVDWVSRNIYWADSKTGRIEVARLDGSSRKVLVWKDLSHPKALALDPPNGYMYWTDWSQSPKLERAWLDGTHRTVILDDIGRVYGLTIDYMQKRLYWADLDNQWIESSDMLGQNRTHIVEDDIDQPMALTQYQDFLYWIDWEKKTIEKANKTTGSNRTLVQENVDKVMDLLVFHHSRQSGSNGCVGDNGRCSHLCLALPDAPNKTEQFNCACPTHYTLNNDGKTCSPPESFLLYSQKTDISRLVVKDNDSEAAPDVVLPIRGLRNLKAIDYDPVDGYIYWISGKSSKVIKKCKTDGSDVQTVVNNPGVRPFDLAIDPYSRILFYSCEQNNVINFTRLDVKQEGIVVQGEDFKPRYLALNSQTGHLFWTSNDVIRRTLFDGTEGVNIFSSGLSEPGPITVDPVTSMIFWADLADKVIECGDLNGGNRKQLLNGKTNNTIQTIVGIAVFGNYLYWVDGDKKLIGRISKKSGKNLTFVKGRVPNLSGIHAAVYLDNKDVKKHPCSFDNGNCTHLCFTKIGNKAQCSCPNNLVLVSDERSCAEKTVCQSDHFTCKSGTKECIPMQWYCDGSADCDDRSDEEDCPICGVEKYMCNDRKCIPDSQVCDGKFQCSDKDDEDRCCVKDSQIKCADGSQCYEKNNRCDGNYDCADKSDEDGCQDIVGESRAQSLSAHVIVAIVVGVFIIFVVIAVVIACRRKTPDQEFDDQVMIALTKPLESSSESPNNTLNKRSKKPERKPLITATLSLGSESMAGYDRNRVTGASSSSSAVTQYPVETLNPPPSPVTDRSVFADNIFDYTTNSPSTIRSYKKHRRRHVPPPPTTPCSTDVCEDSEPYFPRKYFKNTMLEYDSDPYPPPPTPRSHYFSDDVTSCPDSPTTERSYFNPYPPPPSPVANSDC
ncbi:Low-density lipoprotein receptor-related protein 6 [Mactra antiquata]